METTLSNPRAVRGEIAFLQKVKEIFGMSKAHPFMTKERESKAVCLNALSFFHCYAVPLALVIPL